MRCHLQFFYINKYVHIFQHRFVSKQNEKRQVRQQTHTHPATSLLWLLMLQAKSMTPENITTRDKAPNHTVGLQKNPLTLVLQRVHTIFIIRVHTALEKYSYNTHIYTSLCANNDIQVIAHAFTGIFMFGQMRFFFILLKSMTYFCDYPKVT